MCGADLRFGCRRNACHTIDGLAKICHLIVLVMRRQSSVVVARRSRPQINYISVPLEKKLKHMQSCQQGSVSFALAREKTSRCQKVIEVSTHAARSLLRLRPSCHCLPRFSFFQLDQHRCDSTSHWTGKASNGLCCSSLSPVP